MKKYFFILLLAAVLAFYGCAQYEQTADGTGADEPETADEGIVTVSMENIQFVPATVEISPGDTVKWVNNDGFPHTVTGFGVDVNVQPGEPFTHTFNEKGTFDYECTIHPGMEGSVIVG